MGSSTRTAAIMTVRSQIAGTPNGRCCPPGFGMNTRRTGSGRYVRLFSSCVGSCITRFGACTAFKFVTAYRLAKSPERPSTPEASAASFPPLLRRLLLVGSNQFSVGTCTHCGPAPFTAHAEAGLAFEDFTDDCLYRGHF